jgi:hypothetical protein
MNLELQLKPSPNILVCPGRWSLIPFYPTIALLGRSTQLISPFSHAEGGGGCIATDQVMLKNTHAQCRTALGCHSH